MAKQIKERSEGLLDFKEGTLYPTLHSLEKQGHLVAYEQEENGRLRRYYRLTEAGRSALTKAQTEWKRYANAVNLILESGQ